MTLRKILWNLLLKGRAFKAKKIDVEIDSELPQRETLESILAGKKPHTQTNDKQFKLRTKKKDELKPLSMIVEIDEKGNLYKNGVRIENQGVELKKKNEEAFDTAERSKKNNERIEANYQAYLDDLQRFPKKPHTSVNP